MSNKNSGLVEKKIEISIDELRQNKFFIATPCYGGQLTEPYFRSAVKLMNFFNHHKIPLAWATIANESLIPRGRNVLVNYFLNSDFTHLLFIDADIEFEVEDVLKLYAGNKEVVVGAYPKKGVAWQTIKRSILDIGDNEELTDNDIAAFGADYAINFKFANKETRSIEIRDGLIGVHDAGTGFMMIKRSAILKMIEAFPELKYNNDVQMKGQPVKDNFYALFDTMIDPVDKRYLSEDYTFCRRWQSIGGDIWLNPTIKLNHYGHFCFAGNPVKIIDWSSATNLEQQPKENIKQLELPD